VGAQPTDRVVKLLAREGLMTAPTYDKPAAETADEAAPAAVATAEPAEETAAEESAEETAQ
jgi:hypothetical protein